MTGATDGNVFQPSINMITTIPTAGITHAENAEAEGKSKMTTIDISLRVARCPDCHRERKRHSTYRRRLSDLGHQSVTLISSRHYCSLCNFHFNVQDERFPAKSRYTARVQDMAIMMWLSERNLSAVCRIMKKEKGVRLPLSTLHEWVTIWRTQQCQNT